MISKNVTLPTGVVATRHRIDAMITRFDGSGDTPITVVVEVGSYLDDSAIAGGKKPVSSATITAKLATEPTLAAIYAWLTAPVQTETVTIPTVNNGVVGSTTMTRPKTHDTGFSGATLV